MKPKSLNKLFYDNNMQMGISISKFKRVVNEILQDQDKVIIPSRALQEFIHEINELTDIIISEDETVLEYIIRVIKTLKRNNRDMAIYNYNNIGGI